MPNKKGKGNFTRSRRKKSKKETFLKLLMITSIIILGILMSIFGVFIIAAIPLNLQNLYKIAFLILGGVSIIIGFLLLYSTIDGTFD